MSFYQEIKKWLVRITSILTGFFIFITSSILANPINYEQEYYDELNRLTAADASVMESLPVTASAPVAAHNYGDERMEHDKAGNILNLERGLYNLPNQFNTWAYVYQQGTNRLLHIDSVSGAALRNYSYDNNGNIRSDSYRKLNSTVYAKADLPITVRVNGKTTQYAYDISDQRVYKLDSLTNNYEYYLKDAAGQNIGIYNMLNGTGTWTWYGAACHAKIEGNTTSMYVQDHIGNTRVTYDVIRNCGAGITYSIRNAVDYYPFGKVLRQFQSNEQEKFMLSENERDKESGLDYFNARFYDSETGRLFQLDPVVKEHESPYAAFSNNPVWFIDPTGMDTIWNGDEETHIYKGDVVEIAPGKFVTAMVEAVEYTAKDPHFYGRIANAAFARGQYSLWWENRLKAIFGNQTAEKEVERTGYQFSKTAISFTPLGAIGNGVKGFFTDEDMFDEKQSKTMSGVNLASGLFPLLKFVKFSSVGTKAGRVFWSGEGAMNPAINYAKSTGGTTLEMTRAGQNLQNLITTRNIPWSEARPMWERLSSVYARGAMGPVHFFPGTQVNPGSIWMTVEKDILINNGVKIITH